MWVVYKEIIRDRAKSNVAKQNLIGGMPQKHVKNCLMFMQCNDWVCSDWTLFSWYVMGCKLFGVCVVIKRAGKSSNLKNDTKR